MLGSPSDPWDLFRRLCAPPLPSVGLRFCGPAPLWLFCLYLGCWNYACCLSLHVCVRVEGTHAHTQLQAWGAYVFQGSSQLMTRSCRTQGPCLELRNSEVSFTFLGALRIPARLGLGLSFSPFMSCFPILFLISPEYTTSREIFLGFTSGQPDLRALVVQKVKLFLPGFLFADSLSVNKQ